MKKKKKNLAVQTMKEVARELIPVASIRCKRIPDKKRKMLEKLADKERD
jgi:hypothetical protein